MILQGKTYCHMKSTLWTAQIRKCLQFHENLKALCGIFHHHCSCPKSFCLDIPYCWCHHTLTGNRAQSGPSYAEMWKINWIPSRWNHWCRKWLNTNSYSVIPKPWKRILQTHTLQEKKKGDLIYNNSLHGIAILGLCSSTEVLLFTGKLRISLQIFSIHW